MYDPSLLTKTNSDRRSVVIGSGQRSRLINGSSFRVYFNLHHFALSLSLYLYFYKHSRISKHLNSVQMRAFITPGKYLLFPPSGSDLDSQTLHKFRSFTILFFDEESNARRLEEKKLFDSLSSLIKFATFVSIDCKLRFFLLKF